MQVIGRVPGVLKMTRKEKEKEKDKAMFGEQGKATDVVATLEFEAPTHVRWSRYDASGKTSFITAFYCSPAGASSASELGALPQAFPSSPGSMYSRYFCQVTTISEHVWPMLLPGA